MTKSCKTCALNGRCNNPTGHMFGYCSTRYLPMNKYHLIEIRSPRGAFVQIQYYPHTPTHNYRIYYCGSDTGLRYERLGNASRRLRRYMQDWEAHGVEDIRAKFGAAESVPLRL